MHSGINIYFDENIPEYLATGFNIIQSKEGLRTGRNITVLYLPTEFEFGIKDVDWIPVLGKQGACIVTQDISITRRKDELDLYKKHGVGMFFLRGHNKKKGLSVWEMVEAISKNWDEICRISTEDRKPFAYQFSLRKKVKKL